MAATLEQLESWLLAPAEVERLEFKEAKRQYDTEKLVEYCGGIANEGGGYFVLGVTNKPPRRVVGTGAFPSITSLNDIKLWLLQKLGLRIDVVELQHADGRVLVFEIPSRPTGTPIGVDGKYLMRVGEGLIGMTADQLKKILNEDSQAWFELPARQHASAEDVIALLDTQGYFELIDQPYPTTQKGVLERLESEDFIQALGGSWTITNLAAILLAKRLDRFATSLARKAPRFIIYEGTSKATTREDKTGQRGFAVGFAGLVDFVQSSAPRNQYIEKVVREEVKMFPVQAVRELIANALVHQDFDATGTCVTIEMFDDRLEISNPGIPPISVDRFIDEYRSRNEKLADVMRRMGICEERGSGIDKVVRAAEFFQLPAPNFRAGNCRTTVILYAHQDFSAMSKSDRIRACYQHCVLWWVEGKKMTNQSLRERFGLDNSASSSATASQVIAATKDAGLIKADDAETSSTRYARYLPAWA